jgi:hypothetical protein
MNENAAGYRRLKASIYAWVSAPARLTRVIAVS